MGSTRPLNAPAKTRSVVGAVPRIRNKVQEMTMNAMVTQFCSDFLSGVLGTRKVAEV